MEKNFGKNNLNLKFEVTYYKKFSKNDHLFKQFLMKNALLLQKKTFTIQQNEIENVLKLAHGENFLDFLNKFFMKKIYLKYDITSEENYSLLGIAPILAFSKLENTYTITLTETFFNITLEKDPYWKKLNLKTLLSFSNISIQNMYLLLIANKNLVLTLQEIKEIFEVENSYERFFDLEKKIILPTILEIENTTSLKIIYEKIKKSPSKNSKIEKIKLSIIDSRVYELLLKKITKHSNNLPLIKKLFYKYANIYPLEYLTNNIEYTLAHYKDEFDSNLIKAIKYNYIENRFKNRIKEYMKSYKLISNINKKFNSIEDFRYELFNEIKKNKITKLQLGLNLLKFSYNSSSNILNNKLYSAFYTEFNQNNYCFYEDEQWVICGEYNGILMSKIVIFQKNI